MKKEFLFLLLGILVLVINGCVNNQPVCNHPYILVGTECCLDQNSNNICDNDESLQLNHSNSKANCNSYCAQKNKPMWNNPGFPDNVVKAGYGNCDELMAQENPPKSWSANCEKQKSKEETNISKGTESESCTLCTLISGLSCDSFKVTPTNMVLVVRNGLGDDLTAVSFGTPSCPAGTPTNFNDGESKTFTSATCTGLTAGSRFEEDVIISYTKGTGTGTSTNAISHTKIGQIVTEIDSSQTVEGKGLNLCEQNDTESESCTLMPRLSCDGFKVTPSSMVLVVRNGLGDDLTVVSFSTPSCPAATAIDLPNNESRVFISECTNGLTVGSKFKEDVAISYIVGTGATAVIHSKTGQIVTEVEIPAQPAPVEPSQQTLNTSRFTLTEQDRNLAEAACNLHCELENKAKWDKPGFSQQFQTQFGVIDSCESLLGKTWTSDCVKNEGIPKSTEETAAIQLTCLQDVQFDVKAACIDGTGVRFIVENNGNKDIKNFTARFKLSETNVLSGETLTGLARFGIKTYTALATADPAIPNSLVVSGLDVTIPIIEVTLVPVISMAGKDVTCPNSIDSYSPAVEGTAIGPCEE